MFARGRVLVAVAAAVAAPLFVPAALAGDRAMPVTVNVTAGDYSLKLSTKTAPVGKVTFAVKNSGKKDHSFQIAGQKTAVLKPGKSAKLVVTFTKAGPFTYMSTVPGDAGKGMKGTFTTKPVAPLVNTAGKDVFASTACGACHTLKAAGSTGTIGPNLDRSTATQAKILTTITNGKGTMEAYVSKLTPQQIEDVTEFVFQSRAG